MELTYGVSLKNVKNIFYFGGGNIYFLIYNEPR